MKEWGIIGILFVIAIYLMSTGNFNDGNNRLDLNKISQGISETIENPSIFK